MIGDIWTQQRGRSGGKHFHIYTAFLAGNCVSLLSRRNQKCKKKNFPFCTNLKKKKFFQQQWAYLNQWMLHLTTFKHNNYYNWSYKVLLLKPPPRLKPHSLITRQSLLRCLCLETSLSRAYWLLYTNTRLISSVDGKQQDVCTAIYCLFCVRLCRRAFCSNPSSEIHVLIAESNYVYASLKRRLCSLLPICCHSCEWLLLSSSAKNGEIRALTSNLFSNSISPSTARSIHHRKLFNPVQAIRAMSFVENE